MGREEGREMVIMEVVMVMGMMQGGKQEGPAPPPPQRVECKAVGPREPGKDGKCQAGQKEGKDVTGKVVFCLSPREPRGCKPKEAVVVPAGKGAVK